MSFTRRTNVSSAPAMLSMGLLISLIACADQEIETDGAESGAAPSSPSALEGLEPAAFDDLDSDVRPFLRFYAEADIQAGTLRFLETKAVSLGVSETHGLRSVPQAAWCRLTDVSDGQEGSNPVNTMEIYSADPGGEFTYHQDCFGGTWPSGAAMDEALPQFLVD